MDQRATALAYRLHQARQEFLTTVESFTPQQMQARCVEEQCTVSALAAHMAGVHTVASRWIETAAQGGRMPTLTMDDIDRRNHEQFARDANRGKDEVLRDLQTSGEQVEQVVRQLSAADLDRAVQFSLLGGEATTQQLVENALIAHIESHLASIRAAGAVNPGSMER